MRFPDAFTPFDRAWLDLSLPAVFEQQVRVRPEAVAVRFGTHEITYAQLDRAATGVARDLLARVPDGPEPVALLADQNLSLVVWILGILKAGLAYVPLDTRLPEAALARMLGDLGPRAIVAAAAHRALADSLVGENLPVFDDEWHDDTRDAADAGPVAAIGPDALAYIFYTSGSTGIPKGVADSHRNVLHSVMRYTNSLGFAPGDRMSLVQNPSFSGTVSTLFGALLNGATVVLRDQQSPDAEPVGEWLRRERITIFHGVPAIFRQISSRADRYPDLRLIRLEGDRATAADLERFQSRFDSRCVLVNGLGATECGLVRQFFAGRETPPPRDAALPIGFPVPDMSIHVVDEDGRALAAGEIGEIVVESRFLALGYWNNPEMTAVRFETRTDGVRRYRAGDLGRLDADGCLTHLGRRDHQPKIAGQFVDTGELERILLAIPGITQAVVHFHPAEDGEHRLVAYLVADFARGQRPAIDEVRRAVQSRVAAAMAPAAFVYLDTLPFTPDGKLDRRRLPPPSRGRPALGVPFAPATSAAELTLCRIWSGVLEIDEPGIDDPFLELGGDSLDAARIIARVVESTLPGFTSASVKDLFEHWTIRELAAELAERAEIG